MLKTVNQTKPVDIEIAKTMLSLVNESNKLKYLVENNKSLKKKNVSSDVLAFKFPILPEDYIRLLTIGVYQLKQAISYAQEHLDDEGKYHFKIVVLEDNIIRIIINSRHLSQTLNSIYLFSILTMTKINQ